MPVFLNRHYDFLRTTAVDDVRLDKEDLKVLQEFNCFVIAYWFDHDRKLSFSLIDAPDLETLQEVHCHLSQDFSGQTIQLEEGFIEAFLKMLEEQSPSAIPGALSFAFPAPVIGAVMVVKIGDKDPLSVNPVGFEDKAIFQDQKPDFEKLIKRNNGKLISSFSESCTYSFDSISQSIEAAQEVLCEVENRSKSKAGKVHKMRIGIAVSSSMIRQSCVLKEAVKLAVQLCFIAGPNQILASSAVREHLNSEDLQRFLTTNNLKILILKDEQFLIRLMDILENDYGKDLKIGEICSRMGESRSQLYRKITEITRLSPIELISGFRLKKAVELLDQRNGSNISQVAYETGFNSLSYFSRQFKSRYGIVPSAYINFDH
jgi:AraC-like DNA-binding protein